MIKKISIFLKFLIMTLILFLIHDTVFANNLQTTDQAFHLTANVVKNNAIKLNWVIANKAFLYKKFIKVIVQSPVNAEIGIIHFPKGEIDNNLVFGKMVVFRNNLTITAPIVNLPKQTMLKLIVSYQGCTDAGHCFPPASHLLTINFKNHIVAIDNHTENTSGTSHRFMRLFENHNIFWVLGAFLIFGFLLTFTPCVLPLLPILSGIIIRGHDKESKTTAFFLTLAYVIGMSLAYALLGLAISIIGSGIQEILQNPYVIIMFGFIFVGLSFSLFGFFEIRLPAFLSSKLQTASNQCAEKGYLSAAIMGFLSALIVSPCVTPPLVGALVYIATTGNIIIGTTALFFFGFGMGIPLIAIVMLGKKVLPKAGKWMDIVKFIFGFLLLSVAILLWQRVVSASMGMLLWGILVLIIGAVIFFRLELKKKMLYYLFKIICLLIFLYGALLIFGGLKGDVDYFNPLTKIYVTKAPYITVTTLTELNAILKLAKNQHKPVLIDFYANWCLDCKSMNITVFQKMKIKKELKRFIWIRVDVTKNSSAELSVEKRYSVVGPPAYIFYSAQGQQLKSLGFVGMKTESEVMRLLRQI